MRKWTINLCFKETRSEKKKSNFTRCSSFLGISQLRKSRRNTIFRKAEQEDKKGKKKWECVHIHITRTSVHFHLSRWRGKNWNEKRQNNISTVLCACLTIMFWPSHVPVHATTDLNPGSDISGKMLSCLLIATPRRGNFWNTACPPLNDEYREIGWFGFIYQP